MAAIPEQFKETMRPLLGGEYGALIDAMANGVRHCGLRANTLKVTPGALRRLLGIALRPVPWCETGFYYDEAARPAKSPFYHAGLYYIQEPSAMSAAALLPIATGDRVLDVCAAPGGKTTLLAAKLNGTGVLVANDASASRCAALNKNITLMGIRNAVVTNEDPARLNRNFGAWFDKILVDAPCSGEGMFRKSDEAVRGWLRHGPLQCAAWQESILSHSAALLKPGGMMVYATCTFNPLENEQGIRRFLAAHPDFELCQIDHERLGLSPGRADWAGGDDRLALGCARIWPHLCDGEGHFMALMRKRGGGEPSAPQTEPFAPQIEPTEPFDRWCATYLRDGLAGRLARRKDALYLTPSDMPDLRGVRAYKMGLYLGDIKPGRFEPSTAFALALKKDDFTQALDFAADSEAVRRYLNGESFDAGGDEGYNLFCVAGYPLGFGKTVNGRLRNKRRL